MSKCYNVGSIIVNLPTFSGFNERIQSNNTILNLNILWKAIMDNKIQDCHIKSWWMKILDAFDRNIRYVNKELLAKNVCQKFMPKRYDGVSFFGISYRVTRFVKIMKCLLQHMNQGATWLPIDFITMKIRILYRSGY